MRHFDGLPAARSRNESEELGAGAPIGSKPRQYAAKFADRGLFPNAARILEKVNGGPIPDVKFFTMDAINVKGRKVRALRHGRRSPASKSRSNATGSGKFG
jgi:hypothetical protein